MGKSVKITVVPYEETLEEDYKEVSKYFCVNCLNDRVYFHTSKRAEATKACDEMFGEGHYAIRTSKIEKGGTINCKASNNSKSMAGARLVSIRNSQGRGLE